MSSFRFLNLKDWRNRRERYENSPVLLYRGSTLGIAIPQALGIASFDDTPCEMNSYQLWNKFPNFTAINETNSKEYNTLQ